MSPKTDRVLLLLFAGMIVFTATLIAVEYWFKDDGQIFQVVAGLIAAFSGSFFTRIKGSGTTTEVTQLGPTATTTINPPETKKEGN